MSADCLVLAPAPPRPGPLEVEQLVEGNHAAILRQGADIGTLGGMTPPRATSQPISVFAAVALVIGLASLLLTAWAPAFYPVALILGISAVVLGIVAGINGRRSGAGLPWLGYLGAGLGAVAAAIVAAYALS